MSTLRLIPTEEPTGDESLRFPAEAVRLMNDARSSAKARQQSAELPKYSTNEDVLQSLSDLTRRINDLTIELGVLGHLGGEESDDGNRPRAA